MPGETVQPNPRGPAAVPVPGALMVDTSRDDRLGEFRGVAGPYWSLRPVRGGAGWEAEPAAVRRATRKERLHAEIERWNARSRGEVL
ncbi:hypothetical protein [Streptomyces fradiae]|uniref:hypothetical protein n=1 Tax=Streptomyces fradiae TaxID=1906 RepID=UPI003F4D24B8